MELLWVLVATGTLGANLPHVTFSDANWPLKQSTRRLCKTQNKHMKTELRQ